MCVRARGVHTAHYNIHEVRVDKNNNNTIVKTVVIRLNMARGERIPPFDGGVPRE